MDRTELLNAMRVIKDHCKSIEHCNEYTCPIYFECDSNFDPSPESWDLEDGETNES